MIQARKNKHTHNIRLNGISARSSNL